MEVWVWLGRRKKMANTNWQEAVRKQHRVGSVDRQAEPLRLERQVQAENEAWRHEEAWDQWAGGFRGPGPLHGSPPWRWAAKTCAGPGLQASLAHSAPSLRLNLKEPTQSHVDSQTPQLHPPWPRAACWGEAFLGARLFQKFNKPCREKALLWLFSH